MKIAIQLGFLLLAVWTATRYLNIDFDVKAQVCSRAPTAVEKALPFAFCVNYTDGDTVNIHGERIRLLGIDAPEMAKGYKGEDPQPYAEEALEFLRECGGREPYLQRAKTEGGLAPLTLFDQYGRTLGLIYGGEHMAELGVSHSCNVQLLREGLAHSYIMDDTPEEFADAAAEAEKRAKRDDVGIWSQDTIVMPSDYRKALKTSVR